METPYQLFMEGNGASLVKIYDFNGLDSQKLSENAKRNDNLIGPANQIISLLRACSVRSKHRHGEYAGEHGASPCALSIFTAENRKNPEFSRIRKSSTQAGCVNTGSNFSNEVSAKVARQSLSLRGHNTESTCEKEQGSESLPTFSPTEALDARRSVIRLPFMNKIKTMKNKNNPFTVSSMQRCCNTNRAGRSLGSAGPISVALALTAHAVIIALALAGVNLALIGAILLLIYITFGAQEARKTEHNCRSIQ